MGTYGVPPPIGPPDQQQAMRDRLRMLGIGGGVGLQNPQQLQDRAMSPEPPPMAESVPPSQADFFLDRGSIPGGPSGDLGPAMERWKSTMPGYQGKPAGGPSNADVASQNIDSGRADYFAQRERALAQSRGQMPMGDPYGSTSAPAPAGPGFAAQAAQRMGSMRPMGPSMGPSPMGPQGMGRGYGMGMGGGRVNNGGMGMRPGMGPGMRPPMRPQPMPRPGGGMGYGDGMSGGMGQPQGQTTAMPRRPTPPTNSTPSAF